MITDTMRQTALSRSLQNTRVEIGQLGANGIVLGTTALMANNYSMLFTHPSTQEEHLIH
jgi:hypothetical protein